MKHIEIMKHYEAALKEAFPSGATGDVFFHWNEARKAIEQAEQAQTDEVHHAFLQGIRYAANKYEAVWEDRFIGGDVSNFLLMEAEELDEEDIDRAIEAAHGIKEKNT